VPQTGDQLPVQLRRVGDVAMNTLPNQITTANAGWRTQFRFRGSRRWSGVAEFKRSDESV
jgi:hypothetical protein